MQPDKPILLMITSQDWGGAQAYVFNLALELKKQDLPVIICAGHTTTWNSPPRSYGVRRVTSEDLAHQCRSSNIDFLELKHMARDINPISNLLALFELIKLFRRLKPRAIQLNSSMMGAIGSLAGYFTKVPKIVYTAHGWVFNEQLPGWKKTLYIWIEKISARWKHAIICLHDQDLEPAKQHNLKPRQKILVIPNGINIPAFESQLSNKEEALSLLKKLISTKSPLRHPELSARHPELSARHPEPANCHPELSARHPELSARHPELVSGSLNSKTKDDSGSVIPHQLRNDNQKNDIIIGTVANAYPPKNLLWYLEVCQTVHDKNPDIRFVITGDGPQMKELKSKHMELDQADYVLLTGRLDPAKIYSAFDIFVLPSSKEGMPIAILEAMSAKLPIIATDVGACRTMLAPDAGVIVAPNDLIALSEAILRLTADSDRRQKLGQNARQKITQDFTWQKTAEQTIKTLLDDLSSPG